MQKLPSSPDTRLLASQTIEARLEQVRLLGETLQHVAGQESWAPEFTIDLELALIEAANNVVIHGYEGAEGKSLEVDYSCNEDEVLIELQDRGAPIPANIFGPGNRCSSDAECGRGIAIIRACVDEMLYESIDGTNKLVLIKKIARSAV